MRRSHQYEKPEENGYFPGGAGGTLRRIIKAGRVRFQMPGRRGVSLAGEIDTRQVKHIGEWSG